MYDLQTRLPGPGNMFGALRATPVEFLGATRIETPAGRFEVGEEYLLTSLATGR